MELKNFGALIAGFIVAALLVTAILVPVVGSITESEKTFTNEGAFYIEADPADIYTIEYDKAAEPGVIYINGVALTAPFESDGYTVVAIDNAILRLKGSDSTVQWKGDGQYIVDATGLNLELGGGTITGTYVNSLGTTAAWPETTYTNAYVASPTTQELIMTEYGGSVVMLGDSDIFAFGQTSISGTWYLIKIEGTIDDGVTVSVLNRITGEPEDGATVSDLSINATPISGYNDLYRLTSITFVVTLSNSTSADVTYSAYIVPSEVTAEMSQHMSSTEISLLGIIPLLVTVGILLGIVGVIFTRRE